MSARSCLPPPAPRAWSSPPPRSAAAPPSRPSSPARPRPAPAGARLGTERPRSVPGGAAAGPASARRAAGRRRAGRAAPLRRRRQGRQAHRRRCSPSGRRTTRSGWSCSPRTWTSRSSSRSKLKTGIGERGFFGGLMQRQRRHRVPPRAQPGAADLRATSTTSPSRARPRRRAVEAGFSPSLLASAPVLSQPHPESARRCWSRPTRCSSPTCSASAWTCSAATARAMRFDPRNSAITTVRGSADQLGARGARATTPPASIAVPQPGAPPGMPQPSAPRSLPDPRSMFLARALLAGARCRPSR